MPPLLWTFKPNQIQTKHLCVSIHIWTKGEVGAPWNRLKPSSKISLLTVPRRCFFYGSLMLVLSFLLCYAFVRVCFLMPCGYLLGKGWPLGSRLWCLIVQSSRSYWYPGSGVVLDCIVSLFLILAVFLTLHVYKMYYQYHFFNRMSMIKIITNMLF